MNAGFLRRAMSLIADFIIILSLVSFTFYAIAKPIYASQIEDFDQLYESYQNLQNEKRVKLTDLERKEYDIRLVPTLSDDQIAKALFDISEQRTALLIDYEEILLNPNLSDDERDALIADWQEEMDMLDFKEEIYGYDDEARAIALEDVVEDRRLLNLYYSDANFPDAYGVGDAYVVFSILFFIVSFSLYHITYMLVLKGHSFGRRLFKLRLSGNVNFLSILLHEFFWKYVYWVLTLGIGIIIDTYMCILTHNRKVPRDYFSKIRVILDDIVYPF